MNSTEVTAKYCTCTRSEHLYSIPELSANPLCVNITPHSVCSLLRGGQKIGFSSKKLHVSYSPQARWSHPACVGWHPRAPFHTSLSFLPVCGFLLGGIRRVVLHVLMASLRLLFSGTARWVALWELLACVEVLDDVLLLPWLIARPDVNWRGTRVRSQNAVRRAVLTKSSPVPGVTLQPDWCSPVVETFLLDIATVPSRALGAVTKPAPTEPEDLLHVKLLFSSHRHDATGTSEW